MDPLPPESIIRVLPVVSDLHSKPTLWGTSWRPNLIPGATALSAHGE